MDFSDKLKARWLGIAERRPVRQKDYRPIVPGKKITKKAICSIVFGVLARGFQSAAKHDADIQREIGIWPEGFTVEMNVLPSGPRMTLEKVAGKLRHRPGHRGHVDLKFNFKNTESAFLVLTPQLGAARAFAQNRVAVEGDIINAMIFTRCLFVMQAYLYPAFICRRLMKRLPDMPLTKQLIRIKVATVGIFFGI